MASPISKIESPSHGVLAVDVVLLICSHTVTPMYVSVCLRVSMHADIVVETGVGGDARTATVEFNDREALGCAWAQACGTEPQSAVRRRDFVLVMTQVAPFLPRAFCETTAAAIGPIAVVAALYPGAWRACVLCATRDMR